MRPAYIDDSSMQIFLICLENADQFYTKYGQLHTNTSAIQI